MIFEYRLRNSFNAGKVTESSKVDAIHLDEPDSV